MAAVYFTRHEAVAPHRSRAIANTETWGAAASSTVIAAGLPGEVPMRSMDMGSTLSGAASVLTQSMEGEVPSSLFFAYPMTQGTAPLGRWSHTCVALGSLMVLYGGVGRTVMEDLCVLDAGAPLVEGAEEGKEVLIICPIQKIPFKTS